MFKSYSPKEKVDLVANDAYFRGKPQLDGIEYRYMADLSSRELGLRSGQLDVIYGSGDGKWVDQMSSAPNVKVDVFGVGEVSTVYFNVDQAAVRQPEGPPGRRQRAESRRVPGAVRHRASPRRSSRRCPRRSWPAA